MQRFRNYFTTYNRIDRKFRKEYLKTMSEELREADRKNELDQKYFTPFEWKKIVKIMEDPSSAGVWMAVSTSARRMKQSIRNLRRVVNGKRI